MDSEVRATLEAIARQLEYCGDELGRLGYLSCELAVSTALSLVHTQLAEDAVDRAHLHGKAHQLRPRDPM